MLDFNGETNWTISVWTYGRVEIPFQWMLNSKVFRNEGKRAELRDRLNTIPGVQIPADAITRRPTFFLTAVSDELVLEKFLSVLDWYVSQVKST